MPDERMGILNNYNVSDSRNPAFLADYMYSPFKYSFIYCCPIDQFLLFMKRIILLLAVVFCFSSKNLYAQSTADWPKTLLWRISGNGLSKNSFLYGTMHLQDRRLFYFTDSLYYYLEKADGYALEIDLQEFMDSIIQKVVDQKQEELFDKKRFTGKDKKKIIDSLISNVKKFKDKASKEQLKQLREEKLKKAIKNKEMPTIMDAYLYGIAKRQGKWLGGIEDIQDQLSLFDELGAEITSEELMMPDTQLATSLEKMINVYLAADLGKIEEFAGNNYSEEFEDMMFLKRNIKMATRMDSLAHVRSMFFTVGAAHLPGDSGVINLLRGKGYKLEPVFSSQKIDPTKYTAKLSEVSWVTVSDEDKTYEVKMPGKASDLNMFDGNLKMKLYVDITTLTYFMSGSTFGQQNADLGKIIKKFAENTDGEVLSKKVLDTDSSKGIEGVVLANGYYFKVRYIVKDNTLYMVMAGGDKKEAIEAPDVKKFFQSLIINKAKAIQEQKEWTAFGIEDKAFTILFPATPKQNKATEKKAEGTDWTFSVHDLIDPATGLYYMMQVRDLRPGYYLTGDSAYFASFRDNLSRAITKVTKEEISTVQSFPAFRFDGESEDGDILYKTLCVNRGNRVYTLFTGGAISEANEVAMDKFLASFSLTNYKKSEWKEAAPPENDFYTVVPSDIRLKKEDSKDKEEDVQAEDETNVTHYLSFDANESVSYEVFKTTMPSYYWINSDSLFFEKMGLQYKREQDSVLSKKIVSNGKLKGMEWVILMPDNNIRKKFRQVLNGDTLYSLVSFIPAQYIERNEPGQFFDAFRVSRENNNHSIFKSKAALLFKDLQSPDSAVFTRASGALSTAEFVKEDRPWLHQGLLNNYLDDTTDSYNKTRDRIIDILESIVDSSTVEFIQSQYKTLPPEKELLKFDLLEVLARYKTDYSYTVLKNLLIDHTPRQKGNNDLSYDITDSLSLARKLFPEILKLSNNNSFAEQVIGISRDLLDSNLITREMLLPYKTNFLHTADTILISLKKEKEPVYGFSHLDMLHLLATFNDEESNRMLQQYLSVNSSIIKQEAIIGLLKNNQVVPPSEIEKLAADKYYRRDLYDNLKKINKINFYPAKYATQRQLSESDMYNFASYEDDPSEMSYVGEKTLLFKGKRHRFYLYKVVYSYENEEGKMEVNKYLGIAGSFAMDLKNLEIGNDITGLYYEEEFDPKKTEKQLSAYIKSNEEPEQKNN
jgi:uncharacterized protein YbaP (TraB family)